MPPHNRIVYVTDFGVVEQGKKVEAYLNSLDKNWETLVVDKKKRSNHAKFVRQKVAELEAAINTLAAVEWANGGNLEQTP